MRRFVDLTAKALATRALSLAAAGGLEASLTQVGSVNTGAQSFAGVKTFAAPPEFEKGTTNPHFTDGSDMLFTSNSVSQNEYAFLTLCDRARNTGKKRIKLPNATLGIDLSTITAGLDNDNKLIGLTEGLHFEGVGYGTRIHLTGLDGEPDEDSGRNFFGGENGEKNFTIEKIRFTGENGDMMRAPLGTPGNETGGFRWVQNNQSAAINFVQNSIADANSHATVKGCWFENLYGFSIHGGNATYDSDFFDNWMYFCANGFNVGGARLNYSRNRVFYSEGFEVAGYDIKISDNILNYPLFAGIVVGGQPIPGAIGHGITVEGNIVTGCFNPDADGDSYGDEGDTGIGGFLPAGAGRQGFGIGVVFDAGVTKVSDNYVRGCTGPALIIGTGNEAMPVTPGEHHVVDNVFINNCDNTTNVCQVLIATDNVEFKHNKVLIVDPQPDQSEDFDPLEEVVGGGNPYTLGANIGVEVRGHFPMIDGNSIQGVSIGILVAEDFVGPRITPNNRYVGSPIEVQYAGNNGAEDIFESVYAPNETDYVRIYRAANLAFGRFAQYANGKMEWGPGSGAPDVTLYRSAANKLKSDDMIIADLGLGVGNSQSGSTPGTCVKKIEVFDASGSSLGFIPVYDAIT